MPEPDATPSGTFRLGGDLPVHRLGFGAMRLTGDGIWGEPDDPEEARAVLRRAVDLGVTLIDTADAYGPEVDERLIAEALHPYPADVVIATKGGTTRPGPDAWEPDGRPEHLREALEGSLRRLRVERVDLYQLHTPDPDVPLAESVGALEEMRREGRIRHIGISNVDTEQLRTAMDVAPIVSVQNRYNLGDRESEPVVEACEREGLAFLPYFPLGHGDLTSRDGPLAAAARELGATPAQLALAWLLHRAGVICPIPGTSSREHLEENVGAAGLALDTGEAEALERAVGAVAAER